MRSFDSWLSCFRDSISDYGYYIDFEKVYRNVDKIKIELNILNSLIGSQNIEYDFQGLIQKYPECLKCIPLLLAVRENEIYTIDGDGEFRYNFKKQNYTLSQYMVFMHKTGLFELLSSRLINNLVDYATGVETGLDSNGRKNRGGHLMENLVESYLQKNNFIKDKTYFKEMKIGDIEKKWGICLSALSNNGKTVKRFDFVVKNDKFCAILMGDTRKKGHVVPMSFGVMKIFEAAGFKLKEIIIKEQHNCKATGYWKTNSVKYNFLLLAHEYLFVFNK